MDCTFSGNNAYEGHAALGNANEGGGGIYNDGGTLTITDSTFSGNSANAEGPWFTIIGVLRAACEEVAAGAAVEEVVLRYLKEAETEAA